MFPSYYPRLPHAGEKHQITFASSHWSFTSRICIQSSELRLILNSAPRRIKNLSIENFQAFYYLKTFGRGASHSGNKFSIILGDLVSEVSINREVKVTGGPMRCE